MIKYDNKKLENFLKNKKRKYFDIVRHLNIPNFLNKDFSIEIENLVKSAKILKTFDKKYTIPNWLGVEKGILKLNPRGFGFIDLDENKFNSIFISKFDINTALNGDEIEVKYYKDDKETSSGIVTKILKRNLLTFVGKIIKNGNFIDVVPLEQKITSRFQIIGEYEINTFNEFKIIKYGRRPIVEVIKKIGGINDNKMDIIATITSSGVPYEWKMDTLKESELIPDTINEEDKKNRVDLKDKLIITIDGEDTKDFDDAISVTKNNNGNFLLSVSIADVTHYVKEDSAIDKEALLRGTSIYLVDRVIPMLPEKLSNGICSLNPNVERLALTADMEINKEGKTINYSIYPSVIKSKHRLTYKQVNDFYKSNLDLDPELSKMLKDSQQLSHIIRNLKSKQGYIDFEIEEPKIVLDKSGAPIEIKIRERGESEILIENFMVRANETIALWATENNFPFIYRIHDTPESEKLHMLDTLSQVLKLNLKVPLDNPSPKEFSNAMKAIKKDKHFPLMKIMLLRTMSKAVYSPNNIGHFGLASEEYSHFTSPIRRYPDLMAHRMIREFHFNKNINSIKHFDEILGSISSKNSESERSAVQLERQIDDFKKAEFYERFVGTTKKAMIVTTLPSGFFVEFEDKVSAKASIKDLGENYQLQANGVVISNGKKSYKVGDYIFVIITKADKHSGKIDIKLK
ncbi:MAG: ribonuclease R [Mollicutes bacterium PWAP]|nr:ribonuclease R [Mollicutes bacterium PWAP]